MTRSNAHLLGLSALVLIVVGCASPAATPQAQPPVRPLTVTAPATAKVGQPVELRVVVPTGDCDAFAVHVATAQETKTVTVSAKTISIAESGVCTDGLTAQTAIVNFTPNSAGTYVVKGGNQDVQVTVTE